MAGTFGSIDDDRAARPVPPEPDIMIATTPMKRVHPTDKHVGARLRMRRLMLNKSQSQVANALGLTFEQSPSYVNEFLATSDGVALALAFGRIRDAKVRRAIVAVVEQIVVEPAERISGGTGAPAVAAIE
jgi:hypothetical protein